MTDETPQKLQQAGAASFDKVGDELATDNAASRLDELKYAVVMLWSEDWTMQQKKDYVRGRVAELAALASQTPTPGPVVEGELHALARDAVIALRGYGRVLSSYETRCFANDFDLEHGKKVTKLAVDLEAALTNDPAPTHTKDGSRG